MPRAPMTLCVVLVIAAIAGSTNAAGPKSIFDDDWTPPKASETPKPTLIKPPTPAPPDPAKPADPTATPTKDPAPPTSAARRPVPGKPEQAAVRKVLKEVFATQLGDRTAAGRSKLTQALLAQAAKSADAPVDEFVLLAAAIDAGTEAANLPLAFDAADRMARDFDVDAAAVKVDTTAKLGSKQPTADAAAINVKAGLELTDRLVAADDYTAAARVCTALQAAAGGNAELRAMVVKRQREVTAARDAAERIARDMEKLGTSPDDPAANLAVGKYLCTTRGDWKNGLPLLRRGSDAALKALAERELSADGTGEATLAVADGWWEWSERAPAAAYRDVVQAHAVEHYAKAIAQSQGLSKVKAEQRVADFRSRETKRALFGATVWTYTMQEPNKIFPRDSLPDGLSVEAAPQRARITGKKVVDHGTLSDRRIHHYGKAVTFDGQENTGSVEVAVPFAGDHTYYFAILVGKDGQAAAKEFRAAKGVTYSWRVGRSGKDCVIAVLDKGQVIISATMPSADVVGYGFATTVRYVGDESDIVITRQR